MTHEHVVTDLIGHAPVAHARRKHAALVPQHRGDPRLVMGRDGNDPVTEPPGNELRILREALGGLACAPTAVATLQLRGQVPVIQRRVRLDIAREQPVEEPLVESEPASLTAPLPAGGIRGQEMEN